MRHVLAQYMRAQCTISAVSARSRVTQCHEEFFANQNKIVELVNSWYIHKKGLNDGSFSGSSKLTTLVAIVAYLELEISTKSLVNTSGFVFVCFFSQKDSSRFFSSTRFYTT